MAADNRFFTDEARWSALVSRNKDAAGAFLYGVVTTGVFCRPGCSSRLPNRNNVVYFSCIQEALAAGYRPCKRCDPDGAGHSDGLREKLIRACRKMEIERRPVPLAELAAEAHLSTCHFQRLFKKTIGVTPKQYAAGLTAGKFAAGLETGETVSEAIYSAGYGSTSRAYENNRQRLSMHPTTYRSGGEGQMITYGVATCWLGFMIVGVTLNGVCAIEFGDSSEDVTACLHNRFPRAHLIPGDSGLSTLLDQVAEHIRLPGKVLDIPLDIQGTAFQQRVWQVVRAIRPGKTCTYLEVAQQLGVPRAVRAVAAAIAANRLAVAIPCHRVIGADGKLHGYRWGIERKKRLLEAEQQQVQSIRPGDHESSTS